MFLGFSSSLLAQLVKNLPAMRKTWVRSLGWEDPLEFNGADGLRTTTFKKPKWHHGNPRMTSLAPHERLPEILGVPREKTPMGAAARGNP